MRHPDAGLHAPRRRRSRAVLGFKLGERVEVTFQGGIVVDAQRLEGAQRFGLAPQDEVADRPAAEISGLCDRRTRADARAEPLVGGFETRRDGDGIVMGRIFEESSAAEISDDGGLGMHADPHHAQSDAFPRQHSRNDSLQSSIAGAHATGTRSMVRLLAGMGSVPPSQLQNPRLTPKVLS